MATFNQKVLKTMNKRYYIRNQVKLADFVNEFIDGLKPSFPAGLENAFEAAGMADAIVDAIINRYLQIV